MDTVTFDAAMQRCCDEINTYGLPGPRSKAQYTSGGVSVEFEPAGARANVSLSIDPYFQGRAIKVRVKISSQAQQLSVTEAPEFIKLYQRVIGLAETLQLYLDSLLLVAG